MKSYSLLIACTVGMAMGMFLPMVNNNWIEMPVVILAGVLCLIFGKML